MSLGMAMIVHFSSFRRFVRLCRKNLVRKLAINAHHVGGFSWEGLCDGSAPLEELVLFYANPEQDKRIRDDLMAPASFQLGFSPSFDFKYLAPLDSRGKKLAKREGERANSALLNGLENASLSIAGSLWMTKVK